MASRAKILAIVCAAIVICSVGVWTLWDATRERLILATTTSTADTGLLGYLIPIFESRHHARVDIIAVGTGQALDTARRGDADVVLVHSKTAEELFVSEGYGVHRVGVMYNDFIIIGPQSDPAKVVGASDAVSAFKKIYDAGMEGKAVFVSRGDNSGTHTKEKSVWTAAKLRPSGSWYISAGQGMGETITMTNEKGAYTLADRGTWLAYKGNVNLQIVFEGTALLLNPYAAILVNPEKNPGVRYRIALSFVRYLVSQEGQEVIKKFEKGGTGLFTPIARDYPAAKALGFPNQQEEIAWYDAQ